MIQHKTPLLVVIDLESERDLAWDLSTVVHTLEAGTPALSGGHWWKNINHVSWVEIPPPAVVIDGKLFAQSVNKTVSNTTVETALFGTGVGSRDFLPDILVLGNRVIVLLRGFGSRAAGTLNIRVKLNGTVIGTTGAVLIGSLLNDGFKIEFVFCVRAVGVLGSVDGQGEFINLGNGNIQQMLNLVPITINTTITQTLEVTAQWSVANSGNTITSTIGVINI